MIYTVIFYANFLDSCKKLWILGKQAKNGEIWIFFIFLIDATKSRKGGVKCGRLFRRNVRPSCENTTSAKLESSIRPKTRDHKLFSHLAARRLECSSPPTRAVTGARDGLPRRPTWCRFPPHNRSPGGRPSASLTAAKSEPLRPEEQSANPAQVSIDRYWHFDLYAKNKFYFFFFQINGERQHFFFIIS